MRSPGRPPVARSEHLRLFWLAIARGAASADAGVEAGVSQPVGTRWFRDCGGVAPRSIFQADSGRYLSFDEREQIALWRAEKVGVREIARRLGRAASTVSRELRRNASTRGGVLTYRATVAQWHRDRRAARPKTAKLAMNRMLRAYVQDRLSGRLVTDTGVTVAGPSVPFTGRNRSRRADRRWARAWSPEQIAARLPVDFPDDPTMRISPEAIYQALFIAGRGGLSREHVACLRTGRALRMPRARTRRERRNQRGFITPETTIDRRPAEVNERVAPGHWEGDLIIGLNHSAIGTLVERTTRYTILLRLPRMEGYGTLERVKNGPALAGHGARAVADALIEAVRFLPEKLRRTLTWDRGTEMAEHIEVTDKTGLKVYFCDPHSPWQRGTNENTNGLLRQYFPKGTDMSRYGPTEIAAVANTLNTRPRKSLAWKTPAEALNGVLYSPKLVGVASTG
ncbi:IS30 family transposase [Pseudonocardia sp. TRM90224]|uniref:IS30 family transposase n=1 Tax=Pseudonocardia sp. TRM90224 TaxID=2812678 RepID=UPI001E41827C|nr:IS30 family transposase [Pseudonocardia sp. TRM90224]